MPTEVEGLVHALVLDGSGGARKLDWDGVLAHRPGDGVLWTHVNRTHPRVQEWLRKEATLDQIAVEALLAGESRPRCTAFGDALVILLRGVNLNPGADPEDMISIRVWIDGQRIISLRRERVIAVRDLVDELEAGRGARNAGDWLVCLTGGLMERMGPVIVDLEERIDGLEERVLESTAAEIRDALVEVRRDAIMLRRYVAPQRDAMARLLVEPAPWLSARDRIGLREVADRVMRRVEDLDEVRERAQVTHEQLVARQNDQMSRATYLLTLVATVFLPLGLLTGLLGINVGGIPGTDSRWAFTIVCIGLVGLGATLAVVIQVMRSKRWL